VDIFPPAKNHCSWGLQEPAPPPYPYFLASICDGSMNPFISEISPFKQFC
jgi:hypothetical protein